LYLGQARALGAEGVLPKQIKQSDVTKMLYQLQLVSDRRTREQNAFTSPDQAPDLASANESAIVVQLPVAANSGDVQASAAADQQFALLLPKMSLEIRAALDATLQKEIAALRSFIGSTFDSHSERLQGDLSALLPARSAPDLDLPTVMPERRAWGAIVGWSLALVGVAGVAVMSWLWWDQGGEVAALRTDLKAAYAELETLRALPKVVSPPAALAEAAPVDPNAVVPAPDAPDAASATTQGVELVPTGAAIAPIAAPKSAAPQAVVPAANGSAPAAAPVTTPQAASGVSAAPPVSQTLPNQAQ
jgi:hypothetical protein